MIGCYSCGECCKTPWNVVVFENEFEQINKKAIKLNINNWFQKQRRTIKCRILPKNRISEFPRKSDLQIPVPLIPVIMPFWKESIEGIIVDC